MEARVADPKRPRGWQWIDAGMVPGGRAFAHPCGLAVITSIDPVEGVPTYHISISRSGKVPFAKERASDALVQDVLRDFDMADAEEDNEGVSGLIRHFWKKVQS